MVLARMLVFLLALLPLTSQVEAGFWDNLRSVVWKTQAKQPPMIDVLIVNDSPGVILETRGNYQLNDPNTKKLISKRYLGKKKYIQALSSGLKWGEEFPGLFQLKITPQDLSSVSVINGVEYHGILYVYDIGGTISIVNRIPIEEYLLSTLPEKYSKPLPEEALSAIAIVGRTDAYYQSLNPKNRYWSVDASQTGYRGVDSNVVNSGMEHAIKATRYMVLSKTGAYERAITPFLAKWQAQKRGNPGHQDGGVSKITLKEAEEMASNGRHAAEILFKAFPGSHIEIIY